MYYKRYCIGGSALSPTLAEHYPLLLLLLHFLSHDQGDGSDTNFSKKIPTSNTRLRGKYEGEKNKPRTHKDFPHSMEANWELKDGEIDRKQLKSWCFLASKKNILDETPVKSNTCNSFLLPIPSHLLSPTLLLTGQILLHKKRERKIRKVITIFSIRIQQ